MEKGMASDRANGGQTGTMAAAGGTSVVPPEEGPEPAQVPAPDTGPPAPADAPAEPPPETAQAEPGQGPPAGEELGPDEVARPELPELPELPAPEPAGPVEDRAAGTSTGPRTDAPSPATPAGDASASGTTTPGPLDVVPDEPAPPPPPPGEAIGATDGGGSAGVFTAPSPPIVPVAEDRPRGIWKYTYVKGVGSTYTNVDTGETHTSTLDVPNDDTIMTEREYETWAAERKAEEEARKRAEEDPFGSLGFDEVIK